MTPRRFPPPGTSKFGRLFEGQRRAEIGLRHITGKPGRRSAAKLLTRDEARAAVKKPRPNRTLALSRPCTEVLSALIAQRAGGTYGGTNAKPPVAHLADGFAVSESIAQPRLDSLHFSSYYTRMSLRERTRPGLGIIEPCLPSPAKAPPSGPGWIHEIKHDGFRILAREDSAGVRLITRAGNDFSSRFPFIAMAVSKLPVRSCLIDGEAIVCDENGLAVFELIRRHGALASAVLCAFDLLELDGRDLRREPIEERKRLLAKLLRGSHMSIVLNEHYEEDGAIVFREACKLGCEGIVSKRVGSIYRRGRSPHWIKVKNPNAPAVRREAEEDWR